VVAGFRVALKISLIARFANDVEASGDLPSSAPRSIGSWRETRASPTHEVIALPGDSPSKVSRSSIKALADANRLPNSLGHNGTVTRVHGEASNVIETHEQVGEFREQKRC